MANTSQHLMLRTTTLLQQMFEEPACFAIYSWDEHDYCSTVHKLFSLQIIFVITMMIWSAMINLVSVSGRNNWFIINMIFYFHLESFSLLFAFACQSSFSKWFAGKNESLVKVNIFWGYAMQLTVQLIFCWPTVDWSAMLC